MENVRKTPTEQGALLGVLRTVRALSLIHI